MEFQRYYKGGGQTSQKETDLNRCICSSKKTFPDGINRLEVSGNSARELLPYKMAGIKITIEPSPLNKDWASIQTFDMAQYTKPVALDLLSLSSIEDYVNLNKLKFHPYFLSIELQCIDELIVISRDEIVELFSSTMKILSAEYSKGYIGYIDLGRVSGLKSPLKPRRIDEIFDKQHMAIFGASDVLNKYVRDIRSSFPQIDMISKTVDAATIVAFKNKSDIKGIFLPEWHELHL